MTDRLLSNSPSLLISLTYKLELALMSLVSCEGWLPGMGSRRIYLPRSPIVVFLDPLISFVSRVSRWNFLPGSTLISAGVGSLYTGQSGSTDRLVLNS